MYHLEKIIVRGFRGQARPIELTLKPDANFIIGRNGTGKTTLINLIHAALTIDLGVLRDSSFDRIEFIFKRPKYRSKPRFTAIKTISPEGPPRISYRVADSATGNVEEYKFSRLRKRVGERSFSTSTLDSGVGRHSLRERLAGIYTTTWLSLQRGADKLTSEDEWEEDERPDIDRKLDRLSNDLTRYFSRLDRLVTDQTQLFQKEWFLSFLANDRRFKESDIDRVDDLSERESLESIFGDFKMLPNEYATQLDRHFRLAKRAKTAFANTKDGIHVSNYLVAYDVMRLHSLVEQWQVLENAKEKIYQPKLQFEKITSEMLFRKKLYTNRSNQIVVESDNGEQLTLDKLSSGEKQLLIFLSETLLQEQNPYIFLADEPELSMHVEWQEELVPALLKINPNAQVLFATHSPDVVNSYQKNVSRMENLVD